LVFGRIQLQRQDHRDRIDQRLTGVADQLALIDQPARNQREVE
jgi:hypothetical protein